MVKMKEEEENNDAPDPVEDLAKVPEEYVTPLTIQEEGDASRKVSDRIPTVLEEETPKLERQLRWLGMDFHN